MAKKDNLKDYLKDLHEGIKTKKPDASRNPQDFRSEIESIETGVSLDPLTNPASSANVLIYKEAYDSNGNIITGTMPNQGTITDTIDGINNVSVTIPEGYVSGGTVSLTSDIQDEVDTQEDLIDEIISIVDNKMSGGGGDTEAYKSIANCFMYPEEICEIIIPSDMTTIPENAFMQRSNITKVTISDGVTSIGYQAFCVCSKLTSISIPDSVTSIGDYGIAGCSNLKGIVIPNTVTSIGDYAFSDCYYLTIYCEAEEQPTGWNSNWNSIDRPVYWNFKGKIVEIDGVNYVLNSTDNIASILGCNGVENNIVISNIIIDDGNEYTATSIGDYIFEYCVNLTSVTISNGITSIGERAFNDCLNLTTVNIPKSVTFMGEQVFSRCANITKVTIDKDSPLTSLGKALFYQSGIQSFQFPNNVTIIEELTFFRCSSLETIVIPKSVKTISSNVFYSCENLKNVYYTGTEEEWNAIDIAENSQSYLSNATITYNYVPTDE